MSVLTLNGDISQNHAAPEIGADTEPQTSILILNDDILHLICVELGNVVALSSTCRRLRTIAGPVLCKRVAFSDGLYPCQRTSLEDFLKMLATDSRYARFTHRLSVQKHVLAEISQPEAQQLAHVLTQLARSRGLRLAVNRGKGYIFHQLRDRRSRASASSRSPPNHTMSCPASRTCATYSSRSSGFNRLVPINSPPGSSSTTFGISTSVQTSSTGLPMHCNTSPIASPT